MNFRTVLIGVIWLALMALIFVTPVESQILYFNWLPPRTIIHIFLFWGFVHLWIGILKKQLKHEFLRRKAAVIVFISALSIALLSEIFMSMSDLSPHISSLNLLFDFFGSCLGLLSFRLVYDTSY